MDSLTQVALGAAVGTVVLGGKAGPRAALWGAVCGTLPDLDVLVPYGDPVRDFTFHRAESHSLFWLSVVTPALAWAIARVHRVRDAQVGVSFRDWCLLVWLTLVTHALLDAFTVYGTQLLLPFSDYPVGLGSVFIIDPLVTVPLLAGLAGALTLHRRDASKAQRWNRAGLVSSALYLCWTVAAQAHVAGHVNRTLAATDLVAGRVLVTPTPFNTLLWRVVVMDDEAYHEGYHSLFDDGDSVVLTRHPAARPILAGLEGNWTVRRLAWFSKGFYGVREAEPDLRVASGTVGSTRHPLGLAQAAPTSAASGEPEAVPVVMTDLRMGQTPWFVFSFVVAERRGSTIVPVRARQVPTRRPPRTALTWLWRRIWDESARPPYSSSQTRDT
jgi:inner membrane protein